MIRIMVKHPDGKWITSYNKDYTKEAEKEYAKALVAMYRRIMSDGMILCFSIEIQTNVGNKNFVEVIGHCGM